MLDVGRFLVVAGLLIAVAGVVIVLLARLGFRGMPGDIEYHGQHVGFYFPIVTCIVLSIVLTALMWLWRWLSGR